MAKALTVPELIEKLTPAAMVGALGVTVQAISNMKQRGAIPHRHRMGVVELAQQHPGLKNFTFNDLVAMHTPQGVGGQRESERPIHQPKRAGAA